MHAQHGVLPCAASTHKSKRTCKHTHARAGRTHIYTHECKPSITLSLAHRSMHGRTRMAIVTSCTEAHQNTRTQRHAQNHTRTRVLSHIYTSHTSRVREHMVCADSHTDVSTHTRARAHTHTCTHAHIHMHAHPHIEITRADLRSMMPCVLWVTCMSECTQHRGSISILRVLFLPSRAPSLAVPCRPGGTPRRRRTPEARARATSGTCRPGGRGRVGRLGGTPRPQDTLTPDTRRAGRGRVGGRLGGTPRPQNPRRVGRGRVGRLAGTPRPQFSQPRHRDRQQCLR